MSALKEESKLQNGKYIIERVLGQGGFGITYLAQYPLMNKKVAIKELFISGFCVRNTMNSGVTLQSMPPEDYSKFKQRFIEEAKILNTLRNPYLVWVQDIFEENDTVYFAMDYIEGITLRELISQKGKLKEGEAINYILQISEALKNVHSQNLLHRDIKPDNIIITNEYKAVLIDFGNARTFSDGKSIVQSAFITPGYAPVEQYHIKEHRGFYIDIYALGATLYNCLTGKKPTPSIERYENPEIEKIEGVSDRVYKTIVKAMALKSVDRYQTVDEFMSSLIYSDDLEAHKDPEHKIKQVEKTKKTDLTEQKNEIKQTEKQDKKHTQQEDIEQLIRNLSPYPSLTDKKHTQQEDIEQPVKTKRKKRLVFTIIFFTIFFLAITFLILKSCNNDNTYNTDNTENTDNTYNTDNTENTDNTNTTTTTNIYPETVFIKGGTFQMGSNDGDSDEKPVHSVTVSSFYMGKYEITNEQYCAFLNDYGSDKVKSGDYSGQTMIVASSGSYDWGVHQSGGKWYPASGYAKYPVIDVTWYGANEYCKWLSQKTGKTYSLPTEAEWEYAAKGGQSYTYAGSNNIDEVAWYDDNSVSKTHQVGTKSPNSLGLYDMSGNVWEWCNDWYGSDYYSSSPTNNPTGASSGSRRVNRGGGWHGNAGYCRVASRSYGNPLSYDAGLGFRAVCSF